MSRYERLDDLAWKDSFRLRWRLLLVIVCGFTFFAGLFFFFVDVVRVEEVLGTTISQHAESGSEGVVRRYWIVKLDTGETVNAAFAGDMPFKSGRRVVLRATTTGLFGYKRYKFTRYLETQDESNRS